MDPKLPQKSFANGLLEVLSNIEQTKLARYWCRFPWVGLMWTFYNCNTKYDNRVILNSLHRCWTSVVNIYTSASWRDLSRRDIEDPPMVIVTHWNLTCMSDVKKRSACHSYKTKLLVRTFWASQSKEMSRVNVLQNTLRVLRVSRLVYRTHGTQSPTMMLNAVLQKS